MHVGLDFTSIDEGSLSYPEEDFISEQFDNARDSNFKTENIIVIVGTQRCGSTYFCEHVRSVGLCTPHEYFQPFSYMQVLADRWGCRYNNKIDLKSYVESLKSMRTGSNGWLGINLHASHIPLFRKALPFFDVKNIFYFHLLRSDILKQAISYEIAHQTGSWSSHYLQKSEPEYDYEKIVDKIKRIQEGNLDISLFFQAHKLDYQALLYENISENANLIHQCLSSIGAPMVGVQKTKLKKQSKTINNEWAKLFLKEFKKEQKTEKQVFWKKFF